MSDEPNTISVAIVEDLRVVREGLAVLIDGTAGFRCSGAYRTMEEALAKIGAKNPLKTRPSRGKKFLAKGAKRRRKGRQDQKPWRPLRLRFAPFARNFFPPLKDCRGQKRPSRMTTCSSLLRHGEVTTYV